MSATLDRIDVQPGDTISWRPAANQPPFSAEVRAVDDGGILTPMGRVAWGAPGLYVARRAAPVPADPEPAPEPDGAQLSHVGYSGHWRAGEVEIAVLPHGAIEPHPDNPRKRFDPTKLAELADSIRAQGILQPLVVRPVGAGRYQLICGERRWRAAGLAGTEQVPAIIRPLDDDAAAEAMLLENIQREDLTPVEEARSLAGLVRRGLTQAALGSRIGRRQSYISSRLGLLRLPEGVLDLVDVGDLEVSKAEALLGLVRWPETLESLAQQALAEDWSTQVLAAEVAEARKRAEAREQPALAMEPIPADAPRVQFEVPVDAGKATETREGAVLGEYAGRLRVQTTDAGHPVTAFVEPNQVKPVDPQAPREPAPAAPLPPAPAPTPLPVIPAPESEPDLASAPAATAAPATPPPSEAPAAAPEPANAPANDKPTWAARVSCLVLETDYDWLLDRGWTIDHAFSALRAHLAAQGEN